jgi:hypothetical protein
MRAGARLSPGDSPVTRPPAGVLAATSRGTPRASATLDDGLPADHRPALSRWDATLPTISSDARRDELTSRRTLRVRLSALPTVGSAPRERHREVAGCRPDGWMWREADLSVGGRQAP